MEKHRLMVFFVILFVGVMTLSGTVPVKASRQQNQSALGVIRFHVIANSDDPVDQDIKRKVRDKLLNEFSQIFGSAVTVQESRERIVERLADIKNVALQEVWKNGRTDSVEVMLGKYKFPTKVYGELVFPAGTYEALRVVIGQGKGANWWCVMFPPLCFVELSHGIAVQQVISTKANVVPSTSSVKAVKSARTVVYKSKILEWWNASKPKFNRLFYFHMW